MSTPSSPSPAPAVPSDEVRVQTVALYKAHEKIYPRSVKGRFVNWRWAVVWLTQIVFYGLPWLMWNERQAVLFDIGARRFFIFGLVFYPQDFIYLTALLLLSAYSLFLFTAVSGRLWCGYACPQTVYTEIFMWVERKIEGDRARRMALDKSPWTAEKIARKAGKQISWAAIGLWTGFTFVGYFTPVRSLAGEVLTLSLGAWQTFWIGFYGFATYGNAGFMREQVCKYMCPYARFQSAMFDKDTLIITYDRARAEPRGPRSKKAVPAQLGLGDCVDCNLCVQVCPTGIDIRNGLQYECIGCAACVDVCDDVMSKFNYPQGLIRYDTQNGLEQGLGTGQLLRRILRPRVLVYGTVLLVISSVVAATIALRIPFRVDVVRDRASLGHLVKGGGVENLYRLQIMNAAEKSQTYTITAQGLQGIEVVDPQPVTLGAAESRWVTVALRVPAATVAGTAPGAHDVHFDIVRKAGEGEAEQARHEKTTFLLPR